MLGVQTISSETDALDDYMVKYLPVISQTMKMLARRRYREADDLRDYSPNEFDVRLLFDPERRALSEMEICDFVWRFKSDPIGYPDGYTLTGLGWVQTPSSTDPVTHMYMQKGDNILCLTPGQFIRPNDLTMKKGERMHLLEERARKAGSPELVRQLTDDIWMLSGSQREIARKLKLAYR